MTIISRKKNTADHIICSVVNVNLVSFLHRGTTGSVYPMIQKKLKKEGGFCPFEKLKGLK